MKNGVISFIRPEECTIKRHVREMEIKPFGEEHGNFQGLSEFLGGDGVGGEGNHFAGVDDLLHQADGKLGQKNFAAGAGVEGEGRPKWRGIVHQLVAEHNSFFILFNVKC